MVLGVVQTCTRARQLVQSPMQDGQRSARAQGGENHRSSLSLEFAVCVESGKQQSTLLKLPDATVDLTPWVRWRLPTILKEDPAAAVGGPILVTVEYDGDAEQKVPSIKAMHKYGRIRRRDGAFRWGIFEDLENPDRYIETFLVDSWAEHARQHERATRADREVEERVHSYVRGTPIVRHLLYVTTRS
jgi:hypothetical protein